MGDVLRRRTLSMEEVRNGLGTVAPDSLSNNFAEQDLSLERLHASTLKRHELVSSLMAMHPLLSYFISAPSSGSVHALAMAFAEARCLTSGAEFSPDQKSQCMQQFAKLDGMCKCSEAG